MRFLLGLLAGLEFAPLTFAAGPLPAGGRDRYGDRLPRGAIARLGTVRWRARHGIDHMGFLPGGKHLATANGSTLSVWDVNTGQEVREINGDAAVGEEFGAGFAVTPDGKYMLSGGYIRYDRAV